MNIFIDTYDRTYSVRKWTFEHLYCLFVYFVIFALPFYFCFASKSIFIFIQISGLISSTPSWKQGTTAQAIMPSKLTI